MCGVCGGSAACLERALIGPLIYADVGRSAKSRRISCTGGCQDAPRSPSHNHATPTTPRHNQATMKEPTGPLKGLLIVRNGDTGKSHALTLSGDAFMNQVKCLSDVKMPYETLMLFLATVRAHPVMVAADGPLGGPRVGVDANTTHYLHVCVSTARRETTGEAGVRLALGSLMNYPFTEHSFVGCGYEAPSLARRPKWHPPPPRLCFSSTSPPKHRAGRTALCSGRKVGHIKLGGRAGKPRHVAAAAAGKRARPTGSPLARQVTNREFAKAAARVLAPTRMVVNV